MPKKTIDIWKTKEWYEVRAPEVFGAKAIGDIVSSDPKNLLNRVLTIGLDELTNDPAQAHTLINLRIFDVQGKIAKTKFIGHEMSRDYVRAFIRKRKTLIDDVVNVKSADGVEIRLKPVVFTAGKVARETEAQIRNALRTELTKRLSQLKHDDFLQELFFKKFALHLLPVLKRLAPIRRIEIRKTEIEEKFT